jgi:F420-non-reducing hydrogenase large subunit
MMVILDAAGNEATQEYFIDVILARPKSPKAEFRCNRVTVTWNPVEAPRGTLIHDYTTDADGMMTNMNLIVGTTHNNAPINMSVTQAARSLIQGGKYDQGVLNTVEMTIRAYDPCFSCATHRLDGKLAVKVDIVDPDGEVLDTLAN